MRAAGYATTGEVAPAGSVTDNRRQQRHRTARHRGALRRSYDRRQNPGPDAAGRPRRGYGSEDRPGHLRATRWCHREAVGLPARWGIHGLRHYYATVLIHAGASVKTVQLSLGHSTPTVTLNAYVHEWPDVLDRTRLLIDGALGQHETAVTPAVSRA